MKKYYKETTCKRCGKVELLDYRTVWHREKKGNGMCGSCANMESSNAHRWGKGHKAWNKGITGEKSHSFGREREGLWGKDNPEWKGNKCSYTALHQWLCRQLGKAKKCTRCGFVGKCSWANLSGEYRRDTDDFVSLCYSCHKLFDLGKIKL